LNIIRSIQQGKLKATFKKDSVVRRLLSYVIECKRLQVVF